MWNEENMDKAFPKQRASTYSWYISVDPYTNTQNNSREMDYRETVAQKLPEKYKNHF